MGQLLLPLQLLLLLLLSVLRGTATGANRLPNYVRRHLNRSADACEDFYGYACGGWAEAHAGRAYRSQLEQLDHVYQAQLATLLEQPLAADEPRFVQLLRDGYSACRRLEGRHDAAQFVRWLRNWNNTEPNDRTQMLRLMMNFGLEPLLRFQEERDESVSTTTAADSSDWQVTDATELWLLQLQPPWPEIAADLTVDGDWNDADFWPLSHAQFRRLYRALQPLAVPESKLWPQVKRLEREISTMPEMPSMEEDLELSVRWLLPLPAGLGQGMWPRYLGHLSQVLAAQTPSLLTDYLQLRLLHKLQLLPAPTFGRQECAAQSRQLLAHAADWWLHRRQTTAPQRRLINATMQQLFDQLRGQFEQRLLANRNGFRPATQRYLLHKLHRMRLLVGVLPGSNDERELQQQRGMLEAHYAQLQLNASDYYGNLGATMLQLQRWAREDVADNDLYLLQPDGYGSYASPFFLPGRNLIVLPHSLLATPLYRAHQPALYTHSALGFLIAHEMSHGFSPSDVYYSGHGREASSIQVHQLHKSKRFKENLICLNDHYAQMADEKFADLNGLAMAYDSYFGRENEGRQQQQQQQHFFLNFAQFFCQDDEQLGESSVHGGNRMRINEAVASFKPFAAAFSCGKLSHLATCELY